MDPDSGEVILKKKGRITADVLRKLTDDDARRVILADAEEQKKLDEIEREAKDQIEIMQTEYLYPEIGDRRTANDWQDGGKETVYELAHGRVVRLLAGHYPEYIAPEADARIREKFPIKLDPKDMKPGNGRWED